jgi:hypothetical protein
VDTLIQLLDQAVAKHGPRPALIIKPGFRTRIWTYADIGDQVPRVARVERRPAGLLEEGRQRDRAALAGVRVGGRRPGDGRRDRTGPRRCHRKVRR